LIRTLEAKLLRRIFVFIDPNFSNPKSNISLVCKYWRKIVSHKSLAIPTHKKNAKSYLISPTPVKPKRSKVHDLLRLDSFKGYYQKKEERKGKKINSSYIIFITYHFYKTFLTLGKVELEEQKKKFEEVDKKIKEEELKIIIEYEKADEAGEIYMFYNIYNDTSFNLIYQFLFLYSFNKQTK